MEFTHYAVQHGKGWSRFIGLCNLVNNKITVTDFGEGPIVASDEERGPLSVWDIEIREDGDTPVNNYDEYVSIRPKADAFELPEDEAYHTDVEARKAFDALKVS